MTRALRSAGGVGQTAQALSDIGINGLQINRREASSLCRRGDVARRCIEATRPQIATTVKANLAKQSGLGKARIEEGSEHHLRE